jgi:hypothetical protein
MMTGASIKRCGARLNRQPRDRIDQRGVGSPHQRTYQSRRTSAGVNGIQRSIRSLGGRRAIQRTFLNAIASRSVTVCPMTVTVAVCASAEHAEQKLAMIQQRVSRIFIGTYPGEYYVTSSNWAIGRIYCSRTLGSNLLRPRNFTSRRRPPRSEVVHLEDTVGIRANEPEVTE